MQNNKSMPAIIYIAGSGRSGSTLLDVLLGNHPLVFGAGELASFFLEWSRGGQCTCGQNYPDCPFWGKVIERLYADFPDLTPLEAEKISRRIESLSGPWRSPADSQAHNCELYGKLWRAMMVSISQESGKNIIVDSSKSSRPVLRRTLTLTKFGGFELKVLHLVRDPRALMWSALRGSNRLLERGQQVTFQGGLHRALIGWGIANAAVHITQAANAQLCVLRLRYEDLVADPTQTLRYLSDFLKLDLEPVIDLVANQRPLVSGHGVGGNRMRRGGPVRLTADEEWKEALPKYARILAPLSWPLAHKYGYDVLHSAR